MRSENTNRRVLKHFQISTDDQEVINSIKTEYGLLTDSQVLRFIIRNFGGIKNER